MFFLSMIPLLSFGQNGFTNKEEAKNKIENELKHGKWIEYLDKNLKVTKQDESIYYRLTIYKNDKPEEIQRIYNNSGQLQAEIPYIDGKENGIVKSYNPDGTLTIESSFLDGKLNGISKTYSKSSQLQSEHFFVDGKLNGVSKTYSKSSQLQSESFYVDGKLNGVWKYYRENGQLQSEDFFVDGKSTGESKLYNDKGSLISITIKDETGNTIIKSFNEMNGNIQSETIMKDFNVIVSRSYYKSGQLASEHFYNDQGKIVKQKNYKEKRKYLTEEEKKEFDAERKKARMEFWNGVVEEIKPAIQQAAAAQEFRNNPNAQTANAYFNIIDNNNTLKAVEEAKKNEQILKSSNTKNVYNAAESSAITNGGTSSGKDGSSPEGVACSREAKRNWEANPEYKKNYSQIQSGCISCGYICNKIMFTETLNHCRQYLSQTEITGLIKLISANQKLIEDLKN